MVQLFNDFHVRDAYAPDDTHPFPSRQPPSTDLRRPPHLRPCKPVRKRQIDVIPSELIVCAAEAAWWRKVSAVDKHESRHAHQAWREIGLTSVDSTLISKRPVDPESVRSNPVRIQ